MEREAENYTRILALKCYDGWLKIYDNSAIIVSIWLDGKLGKTYARRCTVVKGEFGILEL